MRNVEFEHGSVVDAARLPVEVSFNGQQYSHDGREVVYHASPKLSSAAPAGRPVHGGSAVLVRGGGLHGGTEYLCRFGPLVVAATFHPASETVVCVSPPWEGDVSTVAHLRVALNGQDYTEPLPFSYHEHPQILDHTPRAGPTLGNTTVTLLVGPLGVLSAGDAPTSFTAGVLDDGAAAGSFAAGTVGAALLRGAECRFGKASRPTAAAPTANPTSTRARAVPTASALKSEAYAPTVGAVRAIGGGEGLARAAARRPRPRGRRNRAGARPLRIRQPWAGEQTGDAHSVDVRLADEHYKYRRHWTTVPATVVEVAHTVAGAVALRCVSPAAAAAATLLHVSFNGHDFRRVGSANWTFYAPPTAAPSRRRRGPPRAAQASSSAAPALAWALCPSRRPRMPPPASAAC